MYVALVYPYLDFTSTFTHESCCNLNAAVYSSHGGLQLAKTILANPDSATLDLSCNN